MAKFQQSQSPRGQGPNRGVVNAGGNKVSKKPSVPPRLVPIDWSSLPLKEFKKNFLNETETCKYSDDAIANYYGKAEARINNRNRGTSLVQTDASKVRCPFFEIAETPFPQAMQEKYRSEGFAEPLPLHAISWPYILSGQNFAGVAQCGRDSLIYTYALPALVHVQDRIATADVDRTSGPFALILTDVKKQGERIIEKLKAYGEPMGIKCHLIYGGHEKKTDSDPVEMGLKDNPHIVVACLGQTLTDLLVSKKLNLKRCSFVVLDDGCRLIKNSLLLKDIFGQIRNDRQVVVWTNAFSTVGTETTVIKALLPFGFNDYLRLYFGSYAHFNNPNTIKHVVMPVTEASRLNRFSYMVQNILTAAASPMPSAKKPKFLIFCNTPDKVSRILNLLLSIGLQARHFLKPKKTTAETAANTTAGTEKMEVTVDPTVSESAEDSALPPRERNDQNMRDNPTTHFWITYTTTPLEETDFAPFDFMLNFEFPVDNMPHFAQRTAKFQEETGGKGTVYTFILDTDAPRVNKYLANFLQEASQYTLPRLHESPPKAAKTTAAQNAGNQNNANKQQQGAGGPMQRNRTAGPAGRPQPYGPRAMGRPGFNANGGGRPSNNFGGGPRPFGGSPPMRGGPGGNFGGPRNFGGPGGNFGGSGGNFGGSGGNFGGGPGNFGGPGGNMGGSGGNFGGPGGNFGGNNFDGPGANFVSPNKNFGAGPVDAFGGGPSGNFGGRQGPNFGGNARNQPDDDMGEGPNSNAGVLDALKLLSQLKQNLTGKPTAPQKIDIPFYRRGESPPPANNFSNSFAANNSSSDDFSSNSRPANNKSGNFGFSSSFLSENSSRNQFGNSFSSAGGNSGGRGSSGGAWGGNNEGRGGNWSNNSSGGGGGNRSFNSDNGNQRRFGGNFSKNWNNNF